MALTRKHYQDTADAVRAALDYNTVPDAMATLIERMADTFAADNPRFDRHRFYAACHYAPRATTDDAGER